MSLSVELIKTPYEVSFSGNPMPFMFACTPYGSTERSQDIRLSIRIEIEDQFNSNIFTEKRNITFYPDSEGKFYVDISGIIDAYLDFFTPRITALNPTQALYQRKRYRLVYLLQKDSAIVGTAATSDILFAVKGGMSYDNFEPTKFFTQHLLQNKKPLNFYTQKELVGADEKRFLYWLYPNADNAAMTIEYVVYLDDDTIIEYNITNGFKSGKWGVCCVAAGFNQTGLSASVPTGKYGVKYSIAVSVNSNYIIEPVFFYIDYRNFYNTFQLLYRSSTGAIETIKLRGQIDFEADYERQSALRTVAPNWFDGLILNAQQTTMYSEEVPKFKGDTGFINKEAAEKLRDLFLSKNVYEIADGKILPILIQGKSSKFYSNKDSLFSLQIEWQRAYVNNYYTPAIFNSSSCPAMDKLIIKQKNKNFLQIMYSIPLPYDKVEFTIDNGTTEQVFTISGNAGSFIIGFTNPATTTPVNITIKGKVICDENSIPVDAGPIKTVVLSVTGDSLPIANNDTYSIAAGGTATVLTGSVLANDYDPDGDAIAVVAASGATAQGGSYNITSNGIVTYTAPSSSFNGTDSFVYEIKQNSIGTGVYATVYINVGTAPSGVYAKIVQRNTVTQGGGQSMYQTGEVWIDFFADPAGTTPLDITNYGLTINYQSNESFSNSNGSGTNQTSANIAGTSNKVKIYEGDIQNFTPGMNQGDPDYFYIITFTVLSGTGYTPI